MIWLFIYFPPNHIVNLVKPLFWISLALCLQRGSHSIRFLVSRLLGNSSCSPWCRRFEREEEQKECGIFSVPLPLFFSLSLALASLHLPGTGPWAGLGASEGSRLQPCSWEITVCRPVLDMGRPECVFLSFLIDERETSTCCSNYLCIHWLILIYALTRDWTCNLGVLGWCSNQLSYPARDKPGCFDSHLQCLWFDSCCVRFTPWNILIYHKVGLLCEIFIGAHFTVQHLEQCTEYSLSSEVH